MLAALSSSSNGGKPANSARRPSRTASARSPLKSAKKRNGVSRAEFLAHEQERNRGREQEDRQHAAQCPGRRERMQPLAEGAIADLVVVLQEVDERVRRQVRARLAARLALAERRRLALVGEAFGQARGRDAAQRLVRVVGVVAVRLAGERARARRDGSRRSIARCTRAACRASRAQGDALRCDRSRARDGSRARPEAFAHAARELRQDVGRGVVDDRVHGVEAQAVEVELLEPVERVVDEELAHRLARGSREVDGRAPRRLVALREEGRRDSGAGSCLRDRSGCTRRRPAP